MSDAEHNQPLPQKGASNRLLYRVGPLAIMLALASAMSSFFVLSGLVPIYVDNRVAAALFAADLLSLGFLVTIVVVEGWSLISAWRAGAAGSRLHFRIVRAFSVAAAMPALVIALVGTITIDRSISPGFMQDIRAFIFNPAEAARLFRESQCRSLLQEAQLTAADLADIERAAGAIALGGEHYPPALLATTGPANV